MDERGIGETELQSLDCGHTIIRKPTHHIRWFDLGEKLELQQAWTTTRYDASERPIAGGVEWRTVPIISDK